MTPAIFAFEVGQGDCHLIVAGREAIVIDAGPAGSPVVDFLLQYGYRVKLLVLTHNDSDHSTGALRLLAKVGTAGRIDSFGSLQDRSPDKKPNRAIALAIELHDKGLLPHLWRLEIDREPRTVAVLGDNYTLSLLHPTYRDNLEAIGQVDRRAAGPNRTSAVLRLCDKAGQGIGLWSGDLTQPAWRELVTTSNCRAKWFVVPHHGSTQGWSSTTIASVLSGIAPRWMVLSVGSDNQYSHPSIDWIRAAITHKVRAICTQITAQCHHDLEALNGAVLTRHPGLGRRKAKGTACAGTIIYRIGDGVVLRADEHLWGVSRLSTPMCIGD